VFCSHIAVELFAMSVELLSIIYWCRNEVGHQKFTFRTRWKRWTSLMQYVNWRYRCCIYLLIHPITRCLHTEMTLKLW